MKASTPSRSSDDDPRRNRFPLMSDLAARWSHMLRTFAIAGSACLTLAVSAQAAKPTITVEPFGHSLRVSFVATLITSRDTRYFIRFETAKQEGCSWKSTSIGRHGRPGQTVVVSLGPNTRQGREFCPGLARVTVFLQRSFGAFVAKDATVATFKQVGTVRYQMR